MYGFLMERRQDWLAPGGLLERLHGLPVRVLLRSTQSYGWLLEHLLEPDLLRDGRDRSIELDVLSRAFLRGEERHPAWPAVREEAAAVDRMDIPRFTGHTEGTEVILESGERLTGLAVVSGLELARATLLRLSPEDLEAQLRLIESALSPAQLDSSARISR
jgi:lantibiotic modifying enzyme